LNESIDKQEEQPDSKEVADEEKGAKLTT